MIEDLSGLWCIKGTDESTLVTDSSVPFMYHDPDRSWITVACVAGRILCTSVFFLVMNTSSKATRGLVRS